MILPGDRQSAYAPQVEGSSSNSPLLSQPPPPLLLHNLIHLCLLPSPTTSTPTNRTAPSSLTHHTHQLSHTHLDETHTRTPFIYTQTHIAAQVQERTGDNEGESREIRSERDERFLRIFREKRERGFESFPEALE